MGNNPERDVKRSCDLSEQCVWCGGDMRQEHAHYRCNQCGQRDACCEGVY
jgi:hypothetical protein